MMATPSVGPSVREPLDACIEIETPEHVSFRHHVAGPAQRGAAYLVDLSVRGLLAMALATASVIGGLLAGADFAGLGLGLALVIWFGMTWGYYVISETLMNGASLGKRALRLRVVRIDGLPITFVDSLLRNLLRAADTLPLFYALGLVSMAVDRRFRRLGDLAAGTMVVREMVRRAPATLRLEPPPAESELDGLPLAPLLSPEELDALELFARRARQLSDERVEELARIWGPALGHRLAVSPRSYGRFLQLIFHRAASPGPSALPRHQAHASGREQVAS